MYSDEQKKEIVDYVNQWNAEHNRGGLSQASKKFNVSFVTLKKWIKESPKNGKKKSEKKVNGEKKNETISSKVMEHIGNIEKYKEQIIELQSMIEQEKEEIVKILE